MSFNPVENPLLALAVDRLRKQCDDYSCSGVGVGNSELMVIKEGKDRGKLTIAREIIYRNGTRQPVPDPNITPVDYRNILEKVPMRKGEDWTDYMDRLEHAGVLGPGS